MKIETILNILWSMKDEDRFYFMTYGKDLIQDYTNVQKMHNDSKTEKPKPRMDSIYILKG